MPKINYHAKLLPNQVYHIYNHAVGRENLFKQPRNYLYFLEKWDKYISPYFANYAYCLMPNHFHFLCKAKPINDDILKKIKVEKTQKAISFLKSEINPNVFYESQFKRFFNGYTNAINRQEENRYGSLFNPDSYRESSEEHRSRILTNFDIMFNTFIVIQYVITWQ